MIALDEGHLLMIEPQRGMSVLPFEDDLAIKMRALLLVDEPVICSGKDTDKGEMTFRFTDGEEMADADRV